MALNSIVNTGRAYFRVCALGTANVGITLPKKDNLLKSWTPLN